jgi:hypothetical protein
MRFSRPAIMAAAAGLIGAAGIAIPVAVAEAATGAAVHIGNCTTEGAFVSCSVQGDVSKPKSITVRVTSSPRQRLDITFDLVCDTNSTFQDKSGHFTLSASAKAVSRNLPLTPNHARAKCTPTVNASTNSHGRFAMTLTAHH